MPEFNAATHGNLRQPSNRGKAKIVKYTGQRFNRLLVFGFLGLQGKEAQWLCRCGCGKWWVVSGNRLRNGQSQSCGCWNYDKTPYSKTHGMTGTLVYRIWSGIYTRSFNLEHKSSKRYGQRGLTMCAGIRKFEDFLALMDEPPTPEHSIDRWPDGKGGYWCGQCEECKANNRSKNMRWATPLEQAEHMKTNVYLTHNGVTHHLSEWARLRGIPVGTVTQRYRKGWPAEEILAFKEHKR